MYIRHNVQVTRVLVTAAAVGGGRTYEVDIQKKLATEIWTGFGVSLLEKQLNEHKSE